VTWKQPSGSVIFKNATQTGPPPNVKLMIPTVNRDTAVVMYAMVVRPVLGGGMHILKFATSDGVFATIDLLAQFGIDEAFGASVFLSDFTHTVKALVNAKLPESDNGNDRVVFPVDSGIFAYEPPQEAL
jgi:hypothetical protein